MKSGYLSLAALAIGCATKIGIPADGAGGTDGAGASAPIGGAGGVVAGTGGFMPGSGATPPQAGNGGAGVGGSQTGGAGGASTGGTATGGTAGAGGASTGGAGGVADGGSGGSGGLGEAGGQAGAGGSGGTAGTGGGGGNGASPATGCNDELLPLPEDPSVRGPWGVGVRTVTMGRLTAEVVYPAEPGSTDGLAPTTYDIRDWLPAGERSKVPDAASPAVTALNGGLYRDVPIDGGHGPYPVVIMIHGTASVRIASGSINAHWASRGFVVIAADYPGLGLHDKLAENPECSALGYAVTGVQDIPGDVNTQLAALEATTGGLSFLAGRIDTTRLALAGHSQGACASAQLATLPNVRAVIALTGSTVAAAGPDLKSLMWVAGIDDAVIGYETALVGNLVCPLGVSNVTAYNDSPGPPAIKKRIAGIAGGGHLIPTDLCQTNQYGRNAVEEALLDGVCGINGAVFIGLPAIFDCGTVDWARGNEIVWHASTLALEETLHCVDRAARFASLKTDVPEITDLREAL